MNIALNRDNSIILQVKSNHQFFLDTLNFQSQNNTTLDEFQSIDKAHGRIESRKTKTFSISVPGWDRMTLGCIVQRHTTLKRNNKFIDEQSSSYYVCDQKLTASTMHSIIRSHWAIEGTNHYIRDTVLFEDANRIRVKPENMMIIRSFGYNIIQANKRAKNFVSQMETHKLNFNSLLKAKGVKS